MKIPRAAIGVLVAVAYEAAALSFSDEISNHPELSSMSSYVNGNPNVKSMFDDATDVTILAPENRAFDKLTGTPNASQPLHNSTLIDGILLYHIINGTWETSDFKPGQPRFLPTQLTVPGFANVSDGQVLQVLRANDSTNFISGLNTEGQFVDDSSIHYDNGTIHIVNEVLTLPQSTTFTLLAANLTATRGAIMNHNRDPAKFNDTRNMTFFAPINNGWRRVGSIVQQGSSVDLSRVGDYHMVPSRVIYSTRMENETLPTEAGENLHLYVVDGTAYVNSAKIVSTDILLNNGVMHLLSDVLNPDNTTLTPSPGATSTPIAFGGASTDTIDPLTRDQETPTSVIPLFPLHSIQGGATTTPTSSPTATGTGTGTGTGTATATGTGGAGGDGGGQGGGAEPMETDHSFVAVLAAIAAVGIGALLVSA